MFQNQERRGQEEREERFMVVGRRRTTGRMRRGERKGERGEGRETGREGACPAAAAAAHAGRRICNAQVPAKE